MNQEKLRVISRLLDDEHFFAHINPVVEGVKLPDHLKSDAIVTLKLSRHFRGRLDVGENGIVAELSFNKQYFTCDIPLEAIWGVTSIKGMNIVWDDLLIKKMDQARNKKSAATGTKSDSAKGKARPKLTRVK